MRVSPTWHLSRLAGPAGVSEGVREIWGAQEGDRGGAGAAGRLLCRPAAPGPGRAAAAVDGAGRDRRRQPCRQQGVRRPAGPVGRRRRQGIQASCCVVTAVPRGLPVPHSCASHMPDQQAGLPCDNAARSAPVHWLLGLRVSGCCDFRFSTPWSQAVEHYCLEHSRCQEAVVNRATGPSSRLDVLNCHDATKAPALL